MLKADLRRMLGGLNDLAKSFLWGGLNQHPAYDGSGLHAYLRRNHPDWRVVCDAALIGLERLTGGDYTDGAAVTAMQDLVTLYEKAYRAKATFSRRAIGPLNGQGRQREIGGSACFLLIAAFFEVIDPEVTPLWITGKLRTYLKLRRKRHTDGLAPNLSHLPQAPATDR